VAGRHGPARSSATAELEEAWQPARRRRPARHLHCARSPGRPRVMASARLPGHGIRALAGPVAAPRAPPARATRARGRLLCPASALLGVRHG